MTLLSIQQVLKAEHLQTVWVANVVLRTKSLISGFLCVLLYFLILLPQRQDPFPFLLQIQDNWLPILGGLTNQNSLTLKFFVAKVVIKDSLFEWNLTDYMGLFFGVETQPLTDDHSVILLDSKPLKMVHILQFHCLKRSLMQHRLTFHSYKNEKSFQALNLKEK